MDFPLIFPDPSVAENLRMPPVQVHPGESNLEPPSIDSFFKALQAFWELYGML